MTRVGFRASHEQLAPSALLEAAKRADRARLWDLPEGKPLQADGEGSDR